LKWIDIAETSCKFLISLTNDSLDFTALKMGKFTLNIKEVDVLDIFESVIELVKISLSLKPSVEFKFEVDDDFKKFIKTDE
jgi:signal transduction histidine kinase